MDFDRLVDVIYEAAVVPGRWIGVLDHLAGLADAEGTLLFAAAPGPPRWLSSEQIHPQMEDWVNSPFYENNPRGQRLVPLREPRFLTDLDAFTPDELDRDPFYTTFLRPRGLGWVVGTAIHSPAGDTLVFSIEKAHAKGPVPPDVAERLNPLRPHLARAALLSARFGLERARVTVDALDLLGLPAAILSHEGRALAANRALQAYAPEVRIAAADLVEFANPKAHALFMRACHGRSLEDSGASVPVPRSLTRPAFVAHIVPMRGLGRDIFSGASLLLYLTPLVHQAGPPPEILQALFDLSPAEARVAARIAEGQSVKAILSNFGVNWSLCSNQNCSVRAQAETIESKSPSPDSSANRNRNGQKVHFGLLLDR